MTAGGVGSTADPMALHFFLDSDRTANTERKDQRKPVHLLLRPITYLSVAHQAQQQRSTGQHRGQNYSVLEQDPHRA